MQIYRENHPAKDVEQLYLRSIYVPLLDYIKTDILSRLCTNTLEAFNLRLIMPNNIVKLSEVDSWDKQNISKRTTVVLKMFSTLFPTSENVMVIY